MELTIDQWEPLIGKTAPEIYEALTNLGMDGEAAEEHIAIAREAGEVGE